MRAKKTNVTVGLVGAGGIARQHMRAWREMGVNVVVYSLEGAKELTEQFQYGQVVGSLEQLLEQSGVVDIVTPTYTHEELALKALDSGVHTICEKPLALSAQAARAMEEKASERGLWLLPAHVVRFFPQYQALKGAIEAGKIGKLATGRFYRGGAMPTWAPWFSDKDKSGGVVLDLMVHDLDFVRSVFGPVESVFAVVNEVLGGGAEGGAGIQTAQATLTHEGGAITSVKSVWGPENLTFETTFYVAGDGGVLESGLPGDLSMQVQLPKALTTSQPALSASHQVSPYFLELAHFLEVIEGKAAPLVNAKDGIAAVRLAQAVTESANTGTTIFAKDIEGGL